jgi:hypothetical protein
MNSQPPQARLGDARIGVVTLIDRGRGRKATIRSALSALVPVRMPYSTQE